MKAAEMVVWLGDFNYRVNMEYQEALDYIHNDWIGELLKKVQSFTSCSFLLPHT